MSRDRIRLGKWGENVAAEYLLARGYTISARNLRTPYGEIDLVAYDPRGVPITVFVEVKTRATAGFGYPEDAVTPEKQEHLLNAIAHYWQERPEEESLWRIDVISVERLRGEPARIMHFENAISA